jgi:GntR family transcriptional regulator/MocR family aminotransferase
MSLPIAYEAKLQECGRKHMALYQALRDAIADGLLPPEARLPSTRALALAFGLSRGSVSLAYEMLAAEGYVRSGVGQGTFVSGGSETVPHSPGREQGAGTAAAPVRLSAWGARISGFSAAELPAALRTAGTERNKDGFPGISFVPQYAGARWFPWAEWRSVVSACLRKHEGMEANSHSPAGSVELRQAIAGRLRRERGIRCGPEDIVLTSGSMQVLALIAQLLLEEGRRAVTETPCYGGIVRAVEAAGAERLAAPVDAGGIVPRDWEADVLFVTPARQFPTGAVLTYERRLALLDWASRRGAWIVEDDYDSDFRWGGRPIEPLKALDREGRVIYVGTFSRSMRTDVRIGYAVVPAALRQPLIAAKGLYEPFPTAAAEQPALAEWMAQGGFDRHMRRMRRIYGRLEGILRACLEEMLGELFRVFHSDAGLHLYAEWKGEAAQYDRLRTACRGPEEAWRDAGMYQEDNSRVPRSAIFSFAHLDEKQIRDGMARIRAEAERLGLV